MRRMLLALIVLAVVLVGLDYGARLAAQAVIARQVQTSQQLPQPPNVRVSGFPFLTQALRGRYERVDLRMQGVPAGGQLRLGLLDVRLDGVHLPLSALSGSGRTAIPVDRVHVSGSATFAELDAAVATAIPSATATVHFSDGGGGQLRITVTYRGAGAPVTASGLARLSLSRDSVTVNVDPQTLTQVPAPLRETIARLVTQTVQLQRLPLGLVPSRVTVGPEGVTARAEAANVDLRAS
jgi:hypothetical protein